MVGLADLLVEDGRRRVAAQLAHAARERTGRVAQLRSCVGGRDDDGVAHYGGFVAALRQAGFSFNSPGSAVAAGRAVCSCLNNGESGLELVHDVKTHNLGMDMEMASNFAVLSAKYYCPQQLSKA